MTLRLAIRGTGEPRALQVRSTFYGDLKAEFAGSGLRLFLRGFLFWLVVVARSCSV